MKQTSKSGMHPRQLFKTHATLAMALSLIATATVVLAEPRPGDVFREYVWKPAGNYHVLNAKQTPNPVAQELDLAAATKAEVVLEIGNAHLGFDDLAIHLNGHEWRRIPFPDLGPKEPAPSVYFHQWQPVISFPLSEFNAGTNNQFELRIGPLIPITTGTHPPYTCIYSVTFRIYYDAKAKPHPTGKVIAPAAGLALGEAVELAASSSSPNGAVTHIDFLGHYEDLNYEGDGAYLRWHGGLKQGALSNHIGSTDAPTHKAVWDTSWVPDQPEPIQIAARITDATGLIYFTEPVGGLKLERPRFSVELCKPYDVPQAFTSCQYGIWIHRGPRSEKFKVSGDPARIVDARFGLSCWNAPSSSGLSVNEVPLEEKRTNGAGSHFFFSLPLRPLNALKQGENILSTIPGPGRQSDIHWPGVMVLVKYRKE